jgi:hypothetical protein
MFEKKFLELVSKVSDEKRKKLELLFFNKKTTNIQKIELIATIEEYLELKK